MDMKNLIMEYRQLHRRRKDHQLLKKKKMSFMNVRYETESGVKHDVTVMVYPGLFPDLGIITFEGDGFKYHIKDFSSFNDKLPNESAFTILFEEDDDEQDIHLTFKNKTDKEQFAQLAKNFVGLSDRSTSDSGNPPSQDQPSNSG